MSAPNELAAWFRCADRCDAERFALSEIRYACPRCGGLLEVEHDVAALRTRGAVLRSAGPFDLLPSVLALAFISVLLIWLSVRRVRKLTA